MRKSKILLVDDDDVYLFVTKHILNNLSEDLEVVTFKDGEEAIDYINLCNKDHWQLPEVILLDINMPFMDGWDFLEDFRKLKPTLADRVHIYMVTSSERERDIKKAKQFEELSRYVVKPITEDDLIEILSEVYDDNW